ncbi:MAG: hypothetical protein CJBNEKGG_04072 [Prosthecobacter sp.]|nr:hypothetical protein [Prosthecobacter sp.]
MNRTRWLIFGLWLLAFWLVAALVVAPGIEGDLAEAATLATRNVVTGYDPPLVSFRGQHAVVKGRVRREGQRREIMAVLEKGVRVAGRPGLGFNPVRRVTDELETTPYPPGWLLIAANGMRGLLLGRAASEPEARDLAVQISGRWAEQGGYLDNRLHADAGNHDEAEDVQPTLTRMPVPRADAGGDSAQIQLARIGGDWQRLVLDSRDEVLRERVMASGLASSDWEQLILPAIQNVRRYQSEQRALAAEADRQSRLPPPHLFMAVRDSRLLLRGEVATLSLKRELLNTFISAFPDNRVLDDVRVNPLRRAAADFGPISSALLPAADDKSATAGKALHLGLPGRAWEAVDFLVDGDARPWVEKLPKDLPAALLLEDSRMVIEWLQGSAKGIPRLAIRQQPGFLTLTLLPDKVILAGQVAEEPVRSQIIEAARQKYAGRALVMADSLMARGTCEPSADVQQTLRSLPDLPGLNSMGTLAFARPGAVWSARPATGQMVLPGAIAASGLLPQEFPAAMAEDTFLEGFDHLRHHWKTLGADSAKPAAP